MMQFFLVVAIIGLICSFLQTVLFLFNSKTYPSIEEDFPIVSILLAVRNEENAIERCLNSLLKLDYPSGKLQILIGDDNSDDNTFSILEKYKKEHNHIQVYSITEKVGKQSGKANVLAQLAHYAHGEYYLMTDADMVLPVTWVKGMLGAMQQKSGLAIGVTNIERNPFQGLEWLNALGMVKVITDLGVPVTGMGNNMIVRATAYWEVGGYENLPFSITEDYELFSHIRKKGFGCTHIYQPEVLGSSLPIDGFANLLNQRKRWMRGAMQLPWYMVTLLLTPVLFYISVAGLLFLNPIVGLVAFISKQILQWIYLISISQRLKVQVIPLAIFFFELYNTFITAASGIYFLLPIQVKWKGRLY